MASLTGQTISSTYDSLLKVTDNGPLNSSLKTITDGLGNSSSLQLSTVAAYITGGLTVTGQLTLPGAFDLTVNGFTIGKGPGALDNTVYGFQSLLSNTTGVFNTANGYQALYNNTIGQYNTAFGLQSMFSNVAGGNNVGIGANALPSNTSGNNNTAIGRYAGFGTGTNNNITGSNNIFIGYQSVGISSSESNRTWIGNSSTLATWVGGNLLVGATTNNGFGLEVTGTAKISGQLTLGSTITNGTYTYTLPSATGTIALVGGAGVGTVTSVAAITLGTSGTDLSSTVANGTTTPVITLNVPTASASNRGVLSSTDWSTFNSKQGTITLTTTGTSGAATFIANTLNIPNYADGGVLSLSAIGATANANGATITGTVLNLQPADASFGGVVTTGTQTFAGAKTFSSDIVVNGVNIGRGVGNVSSNTAIGAGALGSNTTGSLNVALGYQAGFGSLGTNSNTTGSNNIFIGYNSVGLSATASNRTWIGNAATTSTWLGGRLLIGSTTDSGNAAIQVTATTLLGLYASATTGVAVQGDSSGTGGTGVFGNSGNGYGGAFANNSTTYPALWVNNNEESAGDIAVFQWIGSSIFTVAPGNSTFNTSVTGRSFIPTFSTVPTNGMYLSAANTLNFSTNTTNRLSIASTGAATFTGALSGTSATFSGRLNVSGATDNASYVIQGKGNVSSIDSNNQNTVFLAASPTANYLATSWIGGGSAVPLYIQNNGINALTISTAGNVGIGTTTISEVLDVEGNLNLRNSGTYSTSLSRDIVYRSNTINYGVQPIANITFLTQGDAASAMTFTTRNGAVDYAERMRITPGGNVGIGTTSPGVSLEVNGLIRSIPIYNNTTATAANLVVSAGGTFERSTSSLKYKTDVSDYDKGLNELMLITPKYYKGINNGDTIFAGLIAEQIHDLGLTEFVQYAEDGSPDALAYTHMVALLVNSIQEQQAQIEELKALINK